jgi:hypothetical protein
MLVLGFVRNLFEREFLGCKSIQHQLFESSRQGKFLPPEALLLIAENSLAMAARYQPELTNRETGEKQP